MYARESWFVLSSTFTLSSASPRNKALWNRDMASPLSRGDREKGREGSESGEVWRRRRREGVRVDRRENRREEKRIQLT